MKNLATKLVKVMNEVNSSVKMSGYNAHQNFAYVRESDIFDTVRNALTKNNVVLLPSVEDCKKEGDLTTVKTKFTLIDADSGEQMEFWSYGQGHDKLGFGVYKAVTGSFKYMLLKTFMISGDNSDPENDSTEIKPVTTAKVTSVTTKTTAANGAESSDSKPKKAFSGFNKQPTEKKLEY